MLDQHQVGVLALNSDSPYYLLHRVFVILLEFSVPNIFKESLLLAVHILGEDLVLGAVDVIDRLCELNQINQKP